MSRRRTGFTVKQVQQMRDRDGDVCAWTGVNTGRLVPQHRSNRGMGGSKAANRVENGLLLDSLINGLIESDPTYQREAIRRGIKISLHADPLLVPVFLAAEQAWYLLAADGTKTRVNKEVGH